MTELHQDTKSDLSRAIYRLWREEENGNSSPIFSVIERAIELAKQGLNFNNYSEVLAAIEAELDLQNDENYYNQQKEIQGLKAWASQL
jgi:hypothetical protein